MFPWSYISGKFVNIRYLRGGGGTCVSVNIFGKLRGNRVGDMFRLGLKEHIYVIHNHFHI